MRTPEQRWSAEHGRQFQEHYKTMRGYIRREITRANLSEQLHDYLKFPRHIADIDGGQGDDARWLAGQHHEVVLADTDETALAEALSIKYPSLEDIVYGGAPDMMDRYGAESFDMVLSHGKLLYAEQPEKELEQLAGLLKPGGYLSLLTAGKFGKIDRLERQGKTAELAKLLATGRYTNNLGLQATAYLPQEVDAMLMEAGLRTSAWFGVRIFSDDYTTPVEEVPALHRNRILRQEKLASANPSLRPGGQLLHFIARKNT